GSSARPLLDLPLAQMSEAFELKIVDIRAVGDDWRVIADSPNVHDFQLKSLAHLRQRQIKQWASRRAKELACDE
ncbi:hypothetical protein QCD79_33060, partial [Pseudomonas quasicaspiana]|nr:hypothetical protein [Pseudomonas quasicaspiana]